MMSEIPNWILSFLSKKHEIEQLQTTLREKQAVLKDIEADLISFLQTSTNNEFMIPEHDMVDQIGTPGILSLHRHKRKQYLSKDVLVNILKEYLQTKFANESIESIALFAEEASIAVWDSRKSIDHLKVKRQCIKR